MFMNFLFKTSNFGHDLHVSKIPDFLFPLLLELLFFVNVNQLFLDLQASLKYLLEICYI